MGSGVVVGVMLFSAIMFTLIIGSGLLFFQSTMALEDGMREPEPEVTAVQQASAIVIFALFLLAGLLFIAGAARIVTRSA